MFMKNDEGNLRLIWHLFLLVVPFLLAAYLLRDLPIRIQTGILVKQGIPIEAARAEARAFFLEDPVGVSLVGILQGLVWFVIVCTLIRSIEKQSCNLRLSCLAISGKRLLLIPSGILLGIMMYFSYFVLGTVFGEPPFESSPENIGALLVILVSMDLLANGFGEEAAFRAYWQRLLIDRHGLWFGIVLASTSFVLLHLLITPLRSSRCWLVSCWRGYWEFCTFGQNPSSWWVRYTPP